MVYSLRLTLYESDMLTEPEFVGFANFVKLFQKDLWRQSMLNTAYYTFGSVPLSIVAGFLIALMLNQKVRLLGLFRVMYYLPSVVSGVAVALLWMWLLNRDYGLVNGFLRLFGVRGPSWMHDPEWAVPALIMMSLWGVGGNMIIFLAGLQGIPEALYDAAKIDGAGTLRCFRHITLPMMTPTVFFNLIMGIIGSFQVFTPAFFMMDKGSGTAGLTQVLYLYNQAFQTFRFGYASAVAWVLFVLIMVFTVLVFRSSEMWVYYESGLMR
jgi:multiple sugar transport system permease protein